MPLGSSAAGTSVQATPGKQGLPLPGCGALTAASQPSRSTQPAAPLPAQPAGQGPQTGRPVAALVAQVTRGSQPPLATAQEVAGRQPVAPEPRNPVGQGPQANEPGVLVQAVSASQKPLAARHSSTSLQVAPSPA